MSPASAGARPRPTVNEVARPWTHYLRAFWDRAYRENVTGLAGMVAYNLLFALFPFALLILFVVGQVLASSEAQANILLDLQRLFPATEEATLERILDRIRESSTTIGVAAAIGALWVGTSFWGAMDTAFCRIYHVECRGWVEQKRWAVGMLVVSVLFLAATIALPTLEGLLISSAENLPFGLPGIGGLENVVLLAITVAVTFLLACAIYWLVPKGHLPWRGVWPGALFLTVTTGLANFIFPVYLREISGINEFGGAVGFLVIALIWFYLLSLALLAGAVINALRYELHDTGTLEEVE
ncbi:MAG TPA: YihY/virulence factor BrkB family protein [Solirubrobacterales bacterium]|jgi:YihY family inner membrane protein|nr:YihY/virulence factor BrkB family protein [Solirubrobacterales bacterium]